MLRTLLSLLGLAMVSIPGRIVEIAETVAFENPENAILRDWTIPMARLEGLGYLLLIHRTGFLAKIMGLAIGLFGSAAAVAPRKYLDFGLSLAYKNPADITVKSWVIPVTRVLGVMAFVLAALSLHNKADT